MPDNRRNRPRPTRNRHGAEGAIGKRIAKHVAGRDRGICHICGHSGATSPDHLVPVTERPDLALATANMKAAHGWPNPCETCSAAATVKAGKEVKIHCNEIRGAMSVERARRIIEARTGLVLGPKTGGEPRGEREW